MAEVTRIEWTNRKMPDGRVVAGKTFNPWVGCEKVSPACTNCYAERDAVKKGFVVWGPESVGGQRRVTSDENWRNPMKWADKAWAAGERPMVFCASWADVFEDWTGPMLDPRKNRLYRRTDDPKSSWIGVPTQTAKDIELGGVPYTAVTMADVRVRLFGLIAATAHGLDWLLLTKRPDVAHRVWVQMCAVYRHVLNLRQHEPAFAEPLRLFKADTPPNVWMGITAESQEWFDKRAPYLCNIPAAVRFVSAEPLVGPVVMRGEYNERVYNYLSKPGETHGIHWVIGGGESGDKARPAPTKWYTDLRDQCREAGTPYFFKQWGEWAPCSMGLETDIEEREVLPGVVLPVRKSLPIVNLDPVAGKNTVVNPDGTFTGESPNGEWHGKYGKKKTGRLLEGVEHDAIPPSVVP